MMRPYALSKRSVHLTAITLLAMVAAHSLNAQTECGVAPAPPPTQIGGRDIPSGGGPGSPSPAIINAVVLFLEFPDDPSATTHWPKLVSPNDMMSDIVDLTSTTNSKKKYDLTTYFKNQSFGKLVITGHPYYRVARYPISTYAAGPISMQNAIATGHPGDAGLNFSGDVRGYAVRHALEDLDVTVNFGAHDTWTKTAPYSHINAPDGQVDLVLACFRNHGVNPATGLVDPSFTASGQRFAGIADLGWSAWAAPLLVDNGTRSIRLGVTALDFDIYTKGISVMEHEIGHLLDLPHQYNPGVWSVMNYLGLNCMSSVEREKLGWMTITDVTSDGQTASVPDMASTGTAYRITMGNGSSFIFENHQAIEQVGGSYFLNLPTTRSWYDPTDLRTYDVVDKWGYGKGIYVLQRSSTGANGLHSVAADGRYNWQQPACPDGTVIAPWSTTQPLPVWKATGVNRVNGKSDREFTSTWYDCASQSQISDSYVMWAWQDYYSTTTVNDGKPKSEGDGKDAFDEEERNVFTPWSNPSSRCLGTTSENVGMWVTGQTGSNPDVTFYLTHPEDAPPSTPDFFQLGTYIDNYIPYVKLTWEANIEPDLASNAYEIWRWSNTTWSNIATVSSSTTEYVDYGTSYLASGTYVIYYIKAVDQSGQKSIPTEFRYYGSVPKPARQGTPEAMTGIVSIEPNPTVSSASIEISLAEEGMVHGRVLDSRGTVVSDLGTGQYGKGTHSFVVETAQYARGTYWVVFTIGEDYCVQRLIVE